VMGKNGERKTKGTEEERTWYGVLSQRGGDDGEEKKQGKRSRSGERVGEKRYPSRGKMSEFLQPKQTDTTR